MTISFLNLRQTTWPEIGDWLEVGYNVNEPSTYAVRPIIKPAYQEKENYADATSFYASAKIVEWLTGKQDNWLSTSMMKVSENELRKGASKNSTKSI